MLQCQFGPLTRYSAILTEPTVLRSYLGYLHQFLNPQANINMSTGPPEHLGRIPHLTLPQEIYEDQRFWEDDASLEQNDVTQINMAQALQTPICQYLQIYNRKNEILTHNQAYA